MSGIGMPRLKLSNGLDNSTINDFGMGMRNNPQPYKGDNPQYTSGIFGLGGGSSTPQWDYQTLSGLSQAIPQQSGIFSSLANYGKSALAFGDQYGKGITEGLKAISALKGVGNLERQLKNARENAAYLKKVSNADIGTRFESQGAKRALQMGSSLEDAYKKGADYSTERMKQWGLN